MKYLAKYLNPKAISAIGGLMLNPRGLVEGNMAGAHKSPFHGFSVEFAGHREYIPGDDPRHIDWKAYYKRDKYLLKQYEADTNLVCQILLDVSESMRFGPEGISKFDYANYLAVSLAYLVVKARDKAGITLFDESILDYIPPSNSMEMAYKMSALLENTEPKKKTTIRQTLLNFAEQIGRRQLVVIISDCLVDLEGLKYGLSRLRYDKHEIVLFHVLHPYELEFPLKGRIHFIGMEGYKDLKLEAKQIRRAYLERLQRHLHSIEEACERNHIEYVLVNTGKPIEELLFGYLTSRLTHIMKRGAT
ncbi:MAG: DUF58 domain-containing protein [Lentisphaerae bacterium]|nr:MAG: DUF58 domain-containing protein [Lentisphaerota bacterium]